MDEGAIEDWAGRPEIAPEWRVQRFLQVRDGARALDLLEGGNGFSLLRAHAMWVMGRLEDCQEELKRCDGAARRTLRYGLLQASLDRVEERSEMDLRRDFPVLALFPKGEQAREDYRASLLSRIAGCGYGDLETIRTMKDVPLVVLPGGGQSGEGDSL